MQQTETKAFQSCVWEEREQMLQQVCKWLFSYLVHSYENVQRGELFDTLAWKTRLWITICIKKFMCCIMFCFWRDVVVWVFKIFLQHLSKLLGKKFKCFNIKYQRAWLCARAAALSGKFTCRVWLINSLIISLINLVHQYCLCDIRKGLWPVTRWDIRWKILKQSVTLFNC